MRLNKPFITILLIIVLVVNLVFFSLCVIAKSVTSEKFIKSITDRFDFYKYVIEYEDVKESIKAYRYPIEVYDYIDYQKVYNLKELFIDNLVKAKEELIKKNNISELLEESVIKYDENNSSSSYTYAKEDIDEISSELSNFFGDNFKSTYNFFRLFSSELLFYITIIISIGISIGLIIIEKERAYLLLSIFYGLFSYILYDFNENFLEYNWKNESFLNLSGVTFKLDNSYIVCFILSFVLLLMYITKLIRNHLRDMRIKPYSDSWR